MATESPDDDHDDDTVHQLEGKWFEKLRMLTTDQTEGRRSLGRVDGIGIGDGVRSVSMTKTAIPGDSLLPGLRASKRK